MAKYIDDHQCTAILPYCIDVCQYMCMKTPVAIPACCPAVLQGTPLTQSEAEQVPAMADLGFAELVAFAGSDVKMRR